MTKVLVSNVKGPKGDQGEKGDQGIPGTNGLPGPAGPNSVPTREFMAAEAADESSPFRAELNSTIASVAVESPEVEAAYGSGTLISAYGAVGDGVADDSAAFAAALAATPDYGTLVLPKGTYRFATPVTHNRTKVSISGPGRINGKLIVGGFGSVFDLQGQHITGIQFTRGGASTDPTVCGIELRNVLNLTITQNSFRDMGAAIYCYTEFDIARNMIQGNLYHNVGYFFRSVTGPTPSGRQESLQWRSIADIHIVDNSGQSNVTAIDIDSIDGLVLEGNTLFSPGYQHASTVKRHNVKIGFSDWLVITGNNFFEAGWEAVKLTDPNHFTISDNNIAWPGQAKPSDAISITLTERLFTIGFIGGGNVSQPTKNFISFYGDGAHDVSAVTIGEFNTELTSTGSPYYYGTDPRVTVSRRVFLDVPLVSRMPALPAFQGSMFSTLFDDFHGRGISTERWVNPYAKEMSLQPRSTTINLTQFLYQVTDLNNGIGYFSGEVTLDIRNDGSVAKTAIYKLMILKSPDSTTVACVEIAKAGRTAGTSANDPSFTFDVFLHTDNRYYLRASRVGSTAGSFHYSAIAAGNLRLA